MSWKTRLLRTMACAAAIGLTACDDGDGGTTADASIVDSGGVGGAGGAGGEGGAGGQGGGGGAGGDPGPFDCPPPPAGRALLPAPRVTYARDGHARAPEMAGLPADADCWDPPIGAEPPPAGAPLVSQWTRTAIPGRSIVVRGVQLSAAEPAFSDTRFLVFGQARGEPGVLREARVAVHNDSDGVIITLPDDLPAASMYLVWPVNAVGAGTPFVINRPQLWWSWPRAAEAGDRLLLFGRDLTHAHGTARSHVLLVSEDDGAARWLPVDAVNPYKIALRLPEDLPLGRYRIWVHTGHGGAHGWSALHGGGGGNLGTERLEVVARPAWADLPRFDVTDFGATGDDDSDDAPAIQAAVDAARAAGRSTVYLPPGHYRLGATLRNLAEIRLLGAGREQTRITAVHGVRVMLLWEGGDGLEVRDMALDLNPFPYPEGAGQIERIRWGSIIRHNEDDDYRNGLRVIDVDLDAGYSKAFELWRVNADVHVRGCTVAGAENQFATVKNSVIEDNTFLQRDDSTTAIYQFGGWNVAVIGNTSRDFGDWQADENTGEQGVGRFYTCTCESQRHDNIYIGENTTTDLTVRPVFFDQNRGEQIMWESKRVKANAQVLRADPTHLWIDGGVDGGRNWYMDALITSGRGVGQTRQVLDWVPGERSLRVAIPWEIVPDETSTVRVLEQIQRIAIWGNQLDAKPRAWQSEAHIASSGVQPFLPSHTLLVENNDFHEIRAGISTWESTWDLFVANNRFERTRWGFSLGGAQYARPAMSNVVIRDNQASEVALVGAHFRGRPNGAAEASQRLNVFEANRIDGAPVAIRVGESRHPGGVSATWVRETVATRGDALEAGSIGLEVIGPAPTFVDGNRFEAFERAVVGPVE